MKKLFFALVALALCSGFALANVPDASLCQVYPCDALGPPGVGGVVVCPGTPAPINASNVTVTIKNSSGNIIPNATITVTMAPAIVGCATPQPLPWTGVTNAAGVWTKNFNAGGCFNGATACTIVSNNQNIRTYVDVKSPDYDGAVNLVVNLADFAYFGARLLSGAPGCTDYDNNGVTNLGDFIIFAGGLSHTCP